MDSGSSKNFVKKKFEEHSTPYKNGWARKGEDQELEVSEICDVCLFLLEEHIEMWWFAM